MSIPRALLLALALLQAVGITDYLRRAACEQECKRDGCDDQVPGDCSTCLCHAPSMPSQTSPAIVAVDVAPPIVTHRVMFAEPVDLRASPDPREILHVPRTVRV